jgi:predicted transposase YbfD/YdcC
MQSSSMRAAASSRYLLDLLAQVPDPRKRRGRRHSLASLLAVGIAAVIAGSRSFAAIGQWAADAGPEVLAVLGAARGAADESTFRRAFALVSGDVLDRVLGAWLWTRAVRSQGRLVIAVDGKAVRGARNKDGKAPHLVAALAHGIGAVLGQVAVEEKSNEIPAVRELLKAFADLAGAVLTLDALHTQHDTVQAVLGRGADYVMTVKANMPTLYKQLKKLPWAAIPSVSSVSTDHGRRARRTIKAALAPAWIGFDGAAQVAQLRRTVTVNGKKTVEVVYLITSDRRATPETLAAWVRGHWEIENRLHWERRDLSGGQITGQDRKRAPRHGLAAQPVDQRPAPGRPCEYRRRQPPSHPRPPADAQAASSCMNTTLPGPWEARLVVPGVRERLPRS